MLTAYIVTLIVGGVLVGVSAFSGADADADVDADFDVDMDVDVDMDLDVDVDADIDAGGTPADMAADFWLPFFSMRFWVFATAFFGLTGTVLTFAQRWGIASPLYEWVTALISAGMGVVAGSGMAYTIRYFQRQESTSMIKADQYVGRSAQVSVSLNPRGSGKIHLQIHDENIELIAESEEDVRLEVGEKVFIVAYKGGTARIVKRFKEITE